MKGNSASALVTLHRAIEDLGDFDQVVIMMGGPTETEVRWSSMSLKELTYLFMSLQAAILDAVGSEPSDG
jgi:hypothetical protein